VLDPDDRAAQTARPGGTRFAEGGEKAGGWLGKGRVALLAADLSTKLQGVNDTHTAMSARDRGWRGTAPTRIAQGGCARS